MNIYISLMNAHGLYVPYTGRTEQKLGIQIIYYLFIWYLLQLQGLLLHQEVKIVFFSWQTKNLEM